MKILIIDATEHNRLKTFLYNGHKKMNEFFYEGVDLFPTFNNIFKDIDNFEYIGINKGPGSFTRTKVSLAYVKGFCYGSKIPLIAISGFDVLEKKGLKLEINAGRGKKYVKNNGTYSVLEGSSSDILDYDIFVSIVIDRISKKEFDDPLKVLPLYISEI
jgi:tRNA A37 threonylcarbamoyladenosine modification protein TsaB